MEHIFFVTSLLVLILTIVSSVLIAKQIRISNLKPIYIITAGVFLSTYIVMLFIDYKPLVHGAESTPFLALLHTIQVMLAGYDFEFLYEALNLSNGQLSLQFFYLSVLFVVGPICTFGFVLSFFESITSYLKYVLNWKKDIYIISDLSEKSIVLARSIRKKYPHALIGFMNVFSNSNEETYDNTDNAKDINAIFFKKDITDVGLKFHRNSTKATFFLLNEDESLNLENSLSIIDRFRHRNNTELFVFNTSKEGELLLDSIDDGVMKVRRINEIRALAYSTIYNKPITDNITVYDGKKIISTLVVGFGGYGKELIKALLWCGQLPDHELELNIIDQDINAESKFQADCPEVITLNNNSELGEARYSLNFYNGVDIQTCSFNEIISKLDKTSIVYVSLGNDELNIETAINIRILFERIGLYPTIRAIVYSDIKYKTLVERNLINYRGESYDIEIIGNIDDRFSYDTIINEELEQIALECHLRWSNTPSEKEAATKQFNEYEYYRNSSIATAIHEKYRKNMNLDEEQASIIEHMRWNAYMRTEGYIFSGSCDKTSRNDRAKMHHNLHKFGLLTDEDIDKDRRIAHNK